MVDNNLSLQDQTTEFLLYTAPNGEIKVEVLLSNETIWLTQECMAELFGVQRPAITKHQKNIFESNELQEDVVCSILEHTIEHEAIAGKTQTQKVKSDMRCHRGRWERVGETMNNMSFDLPALPSAGRQVEKRLDGVET